MIQSRNWEGRGTEKKKKQPTASWGWMAFQTASAIQKILEKKKKKQKKKNWYRMMWYVCTLKWGKDALFCFEKDVWIIKLMRPSFGRFGWLHIEIVGWMRQSGCRDVFGCAECACVDSFSAMRSEKQTNKQTNSSSKPDVKPTRHFTDNIILLFWSLLHVWRVCCEYPKLNNKIRRQQS